MSFARRTLIAAAAVIALAALPGQAAAQDHDMGNDGVSTFGEDFPHGVTFWTRREPDGCWLCAPAIDINGGLFKMKASPDDISETFWRLHTQWGLGIRHLALSADILWIPKLSQSSPTVSFVAQYEPISQQKRLYASVGVGMISGHDQSGNGFTPWGQAVIAYRSQIHDIAPFVQIGRALNGNDRENEILLGLAHPIAPYRMHGLH
ncbi:MAG TPA: hypothetical protein VG940_12635 [Gemmatimonadales bacterium]|nr:hypothetical protein [Gemmatimonadales bacterium]